MSVVACIGAGNVGRAWAVVFARAGHSVRLYDANPAEIRDRALPLAATLLGDLARAGVLTETPDEVLARISPAASLAEAAAEAGWIQESVREDLSLKRAVLTEIAAAAAPEAIIASSTSAIRGSEFMTAIAGPGRALVAHPVNPPALIPLVELCATPLTAPETLAEARRFMTALGMRPITVNREIDGFILNRLQYTLVAEALHLVGEGYCSAEDIDAVVTQGLALRWASIGPFEVAHLNATEGFMGFVRQLGPMMRRMGADARTDYDWSEALAQDIHDAIARRMPVERIGELQAWRDRRILATRAMQATDLPPVADAEEGHRK